MFVLYFYRLCGNNILLLLLLLFIPNIVLKLAEIHISYSPSKMLHILKSVNKKSNKITKMLMSEFLKVALVGYFQL